MTKIHAFVICWVTFWAFAALRDIYAPPGAGPDDAMVSVKIGPEMNKDCPEVQKGTLCPPRI